MTNIVDLRKPKIDIDTVSLLEELLDKAKAGELKSFMYVDKYHNGGGCGYGWAGLPDYEMIGKLIALQNLFIAVNQEEDE